MIEQNPLPPCDPGVYQRGQSVCLVDIPKETAELMCKVFSQATKFQGYFAGGEKPTPASLDEGRTVKVECTIDGPSDNLLAHDCAIQADN